MNYRYFRPHSLTWWAGVFSLIIGVLQLMGTGGWANEIGQIIALLSGGQDASPAASLVLGFGLIGIRDRLERVFRASDDAQNEGQA